MTDTTTPAAGGALDNWETSQPTGTTPCPHAGRHLDAGAKFEPGDRVYAGGAIGIARPCPWCSGAALILDQHFDAMAAAQAGLTSAERHRARAMLTTPATDETPAELARQGLDAALGLTERLGGRGLPSQRRLSALDPDQRARAVALQVADDVLLVREDATVGDLLALADYIVTGTRATDGAGQ